jgi:hypothetical protein
MARCPPRLRLRARSPLLRQLDHVDGRRVSPPLARPAFQRRLEFPDRRGSRPTTRTSAIRIQGLSIKPVDGDFTQPTLPEHAQMRSRYRRSRRRVEPALIK